jgi:hypothetical protein
MRRNALRRSPEEDAALQQKMSAILGAFRVARTVAVEIDPSRLLALPSVALF